MDLHDSQGKEEGSFSSPEAVVPEERLEEDEEAEGLRIDHLQR